LGITTLGAALAAVATVADEEVRTVPTARPFDALMLDAWIAEGLSSSNRLTLFGAGGASRIGSAGVMAAGVLSPGIDAEDQSAGGESPQHLPPEL
jgi:hypothetical protein